MLRGLMIQLMAAAWVLVIAFPASASPALDAQEINAKAEATALAIRDGRYDEAEKIIRGVIAESKITNWTYSPFDTFIYRVTESADQSWVPYFDSWVDTHKQSPLPYLFRAKYYYQLALDPESDVGGKLTSQELIKNLAYVSIAWRDILKVIRLDDKTPYSAYLFAHIARLAAPVAERERIFEAAVKTYPDYYFLYSDRLSQLSPKSGGSIFSMMYFTYNHTFNLRDNSPMRMLGLDLYLDLVENVEADCKAYDESAKILCEKRQGDMLHNASLIQKMKDAFTLYDTIGHYEFNRALVSKLWCKCLATSPYTLTMFGVLQEGLGNDNYAINEGYGYLYYNLKSYAKALDYYNKALSEIQAFDFPNQEGKDAALADMYYNIALTSDKLDDDKNAMKYITSAIALTGHNADYYRERCSLDLKLGDQKESIGDCLKADMAKSHMQVHATRH